MKTCIVIPIYKSTLNFFEEISLKQTMQKLHMFDVFFCEPNSIDTSAIRKTYPNIKNIKFENSFFKGILGYNQLMLSLKFYEQFKAYDYMLLCQLDVFIFKNELTEWVKKDYDYIGAPWLATADNLLKKIKYKIKPLLKKDREKIFFKVGNGGLSLRKINTFIEVLTNNPEEIKKQLNIPKKDFRLMEDVFWSTKAPLLYSPFKIPNYKEAVFFAIDRRPKIGFKLTKNVLPFGCHGFNKNNVIKFWETKIPGLKQS